MWLGQRVQGARYRHGTSKRQPWPWLMTQALVPVAQRRTWRPGKVQLLAPY